MKKAAFLFFILLFPALFYIFLTTGKHNFISLPYYGPKDVAAGSTDTIYHTIPPFSFTNQDGQTVTDKTFDGKIYVVDFFFATCQSICPKMATNMHVVQEAFKDYDSIMMLSHTVNPEFDTAEVLKKYSNEVHANTKKWQFITGNKKNLYDIAYKGYLLNAVEDTTQTDIQAQFLHDEHFILVDREKHIRGIYDGTSLVDVNKLIDDIKLLTAEYYIKQQKKNAKK